MDQHTDVAAYLRDRYTKAVAPSGWIREDGLTALVDALMDVRDEAMERLRAERCTCGETACESALCDCDAIPCPVNHRAEDADAGRDALKVELAETWLRVNSLSEKEGQEYRRAEKAEAELARHVAAVWTVPGEEPETVIAERDALRAQLEAESDLYYLLKEERDTLRATVEAFLAVNADRLRSGDTTADLAELAYNYWHLTGWTALDVPENHEDATADIHGRTWDRHPFVQSLAVDNVEVCICGQVPSRSIHAPESAPTAAKETP